MAKTAEAEPKAAGSLIVRLARALFPLGVVNPLLIVLLAAQVVISIYMLLRLFPLAIDVKNGHTSSLTAQFFFRRRLFSADQVYLWSVVGAGALGGAVTETLAIDKNMKRLSASDLGHFFTRLLVAVSLPLIFYAAVRGGLLNIGTTGGRDLNPYTVIASAGIVGMFTERAVQMLKGKLTSDDASPPAAREPQEKPDKNPKV
jgi:hypothetical protein